MKTIEEKAKEYIELKKARYTVEKRLYELREDLYSAPTSTLRGCGLEIQQRNYTSYDEDRVFELLDKRGYERTEYCTLVIDSSKIEEMYLNEELTDSDLRYIRKPKYGWALVGSGKDV